MTDQQRVKRCDRADLRILFHLPFFAPGACRLPVEFSTEFPKACTDGKRIMINPDWLDTIKDEHITTVKCHEILHPLLGHLWRMPTGADHDLWNQACDYVVNGMLKDFSKTFTAKGLADPFPFPPGDYLYDQCYDGMCEEQIYTLLSSRKSGQQGQQVQQGNQPGQQGQGQGQGQQPGQQPGNQPGKGQQGSKPGQFGQFTVANGNSQSGKADANSWKCTMIQSASGKAKGSVPSGILREIDSLLDPGVPWYELLNRWLKERATDDYNWQKPNVYFPGEFILPIMESEKIGYLVFATDTSGSIDHEALARFQAAKQAALDDLTPRTLIDIYCDACVHRVDEYRPGDTIAKRAPGGGGTDFRPVFDHVAKLDEPPKCLVYLTDLQGTFPAEAPPYPVLWVVWGDEKPPWGELVQI